MSIFERFFHKQKNEKTKIESKKEPLTYWAAICESCSTRTFGDPEMRFCPKCGRAIKWVELTKKEVWPERYESNGD